MADQEPKMAFCDGLARLIGSADLADFTITCKDMKWPVHRVVLSIHSAVLARSSGGDFKEAAQKSHDLSEYSNNQVQALVDYMYIFDYSTSPDDTYSDNARFHLEIGIMADKYDLCSLKKLAVNKLAYTVAQIDCADDFVEAIELAYSVECATADMRKVLIDRMIECDLFQFEGDEPSHVEEVMESYPRFAIEAFRAQQEWHRKKQEESDSLNLFKCFNCSVYFKACLPFTDSDEEGPVEFHACEACDFSMSYDQWQSCIIWEG